LAPFSKTFLPSLSLLVTCSSPELDLSLLSHDLPAPNRGGNFKVIETSSSEYRRIFAARLPIGEPANRRPQLSVRTTTEPTASLSTRSHSIRATVPTAPPCTSAMLFSTAFGRRKASKLTVVPSTTSGLQMRSSPPSGSTRMPGWPGKPHCAA
jgi:hypothetical protein